MCVAVCVLSYLTLFTSFHHLSTFVCPTELISFSDRIEEFLKVNCEVIACSTDSEYCHSAWWVEYMSYAHTRVYVYRNVYVRI